MREGERTREQSNIAVWLGTLPPVVRHSLDVRDPIAFLERDLVILTGVVTTTEAVSHHVLEKIHDKDTYS